MGHFTAMALIRREGLAVFQGGPIFGSRHRHRHRRVWPAIERELKGAQSVIPLLTYNLTSPWTDSVYMVDASTWGCGIFTAIASGEQLQSICAHSERWRFKHREVPARLLAHKQMFAGIASREGAEEAQEFLDK